MPQEYQHSPHGSSALVGARAYWLYLLPSPLVIKLLWSVLTTNFAKIAFTAAALFFFYSAAHLTRTTLMRLHHAASQPSSRPQKLRDYRLWGAIYVTVGVLIVMFMLPRALPAKLLMAAVAFVGYWLMYGLPPRQKAPDVDYDGMPNATREAIKAAFADLEQIQTLAQPLRSHDKQLADTLEKVVEQSYTIMDLLVENPQDVGRARRFLNVYINRIKEILQQYLKLAQHGKADNLRQRLQATLEEVEQAFRDKKSQLLDDDQFKLDTQLAVLDEQIKHEN